MTRAKLALPLPRFINPASVEIGDTIRVVWTANGIEYSRTGTVQRIIQSGNVVEAFTDEGGTILHWLPPHDKVCRVTLLATAKPEETMLDIFEDGKVEIGV